MLSVILAAFLIPLVISWILTRVLIAVAPRLGLMDTPNERKVHQRTTPLGGGLAIYFAVVSTLALVVAVAWLSQRFPQLNAHLPATVPQHADGVLAKAGLLGLIVAAATVQMVLGLIDDWRPRGLSYQFRLAVEMGLVGLLIYNGLSVSVFTDSLWITAPLTILWVVGLTNALNFLDNMDALSGGVTFLAAILFAIVSSLVGDLFVSGCFVILAGALLGFLRYNWNPAKIFMGDAGSNFLGFWLGVLTVIGTYNIDPFDHVTIFAPLCILAVPIYDSVTVIAIRLAQGSSPFKPDKQHFSHRLVELGFSSKNAVLMIYLICVTTGLSGLLLYFIDAHAAGLVLAQVLCMLGVIALLEAVSRRPRRRKRHRADRNASAHRAEPESTSSESPSPSEQAL